MNEISNIPKSFNFSKLHQTSTADIYHAPYIYKLSVGYKKTNILTLQFNIFSTCISPYRALRCIRII